MEILEWFAFEGLILPIAIMAWGGWLIHFGPTRPKSDPDAIAAMPALLRFLARHNFERPAGIFMALCGLLIGILRLPSLA